MISIKDIAKASGVSTATVSLALNHSDLISEQTRERVCRIADEMGYLPNPYARRLVKQRSDMLGLIVPDIRNVYYAALVHHVNHAVRAAGYGMIIAMSENNPAYEEKIVEEMIASRVDGLLLSPLNSVGHTLSYLEHFPLPLAFVSSRYEDCPYPAVIPDYQNGMAEITRMALEKGRKHILFMTGPKGEYSLEQRKQGFLCAAGENGMVVHCREVSYADATEATEQLLAEANGSLFFDAILCVNDTMAAGVENVLLRHGISIPETVAVGGYDDVLFAETTAVPLTTVKQDIKMIAETAVSLLLERIAGNKIPQITTVPVTLIHRDSL